MTSCSELRQITSVSHCWAEGLLDPVSAGNESSTAPPIASKTLLRRHAQVTRCFHSTKTSKPWALGLIGLAIAIALWGFGYKISRYNPHPAPSSRASVAKLWDKHQDIAQISSGAKANAQSLAPRPALILVHYTHTQRPEAFCRGSEFNRLSALFRSATPLRSPPSRTLLA